MSAAPFHLAWFLQGSSIQAWGEPWTGHISDDWMSCDMFIDLARGCERAGMDYMLLEDSIYVGETYGGARDFYLKKGLSNMALPAFEFSVKADPANPVFQYHLGLTYDRLGDKTRARTALQRALALQPDFEGSADARRVLSAL